MRTPKLCHDASIFEDRMGAAKIPPPPVMQPTAAPGASRLEQLPEDLFLRIADQMRMRVGDNLQLQRVSKTLRQRLRIDALWKQVLVGAPFRATTKAASKDSASRCDRYFFRYMAAISRLDRSQIFSTAQERSYTLRLLARQPLRHDPVRHGRLGDAHQYVFSAPKSFDLALFHDNGVPKPVHTCGRYNELASEQPLLRPWLTPLAAPPFSLEKSTKIALADCGMPRGMWIFLLAQGVMDEGWIPAAYRGDPWFDFLRVALCFSTPLWLPRSHLRQHTELEQLERFGQADERFRALIAHGLPWVTSMPRELLLHVELFRFCPAAASFVYKRVARRWPFSSLPKEAYDTLCATVAADPLCFWHLPAPMKIEPGFARAGIVSHPQVVCEAIAPHLLRDLRFLRSVMPLLERRPRTWENLLIALYLDSRDVTRRPGPPVLAGLGAEGLKRAALSFLCAAQQGPCAERTPEALQQWLIVLGVTLGRYANESHVELYALAHLCSLKELRAIIASLEKNAELSPKTMIEIFRSVVQEKHKARQKKPITPIVFSTAENALDSRRLQSPWRGIFKIGQAHRP